MKLLSFTSTVSTPVVRAPSTCFFTGFVYNDAEDVAEGMIYGRMLWMTGRSRSRTILRQKKNCDKGSIMNCIRREGDGREERIRVRSERGEEREGEWVRG